MIAKKHTKLWDWQQRIKNGQYECLKCSSKENLSVDHIIPCSILEPLYYDSPEGRYDMLYNDEENFQILCKYCNGQKAGKLDVRNPKTIILLERLVNNLKAL